MKTLKREDFKKIHSIACNSWQPKLIEWYGSKFAVQDEVEVKDSEYKIMRDACTDEQHKLFDEIFGKAADVTDVVQSVEDAIKYLGEKDEDVQNLMKSRGMKLTDSLIAYQEAVVFCKAINEGWFPDYNDTSQYKYFVYIYMKNGKPTFDGYCWCSLSAGVSSRLTLKNRNLCEHAIKCISDVYERFMIK